MLVSVLYGPESEDILIGCGYTGDQVTNLREDVFMHRVRYSLTTTMDEEERDNFLDKAVKALEK